MKISVRFGQKTINIEVDAELRLDTLLCLIQMEGDIRGTVEELQIAKNSQNIDCTAGRTVADAGLKEGDVLMLFRKLGTPRRSVSAGPANNGRRVSPAPVPGHLPVIERQLALQRNLEAAMEDIPEAFVPVQMLYAQLRLNGKEIIAFVDTGAQVSILSENAAKHCGLMNMVDPRFKIRAQGVGGATEALGRIMRCEMGVGDHSLPCSLVVLPHPGAGVDFILGLDILLKHRAVVDLGTRSIRFNNEVSVPLLSEAETTHLSVFGVKSATSTSTTVFAAKTD